MNDYNRRLIVWASNGGSPTHPGWYHNLLAHPHVTVEVGTETFDAIAVVTAGAERDRLWARGVAVYPILAEHQAKTTRQIPVIAPSRQASGRPGGAPLCLEPSLFCSPFRGTHAPSLGCC